MQFSVIVPAFNETSLIRPFLQHLRERAPGAEIIVAAEVPQGCLNEIERIMDDPKVVGGYFRIRLPRRLVYRLTDSFAHYAGILSRMRCGDHGIFCRRTVFVDIGGFPEVPLMEDV